MGLLDGIMGAMVQSIIQQQQEAAKMQGASHISNPVPKLEPAGGGYIPYMPTTPARDRYRGPTVGFM